MDHYSWALYLHDSHQYLVWCDLIKVQNPASSLAPNEMPWIEIAHQSIINFMAINTLKPEHNCKKVPGENANFLKPFLYFDKKKSTSAEAGIFWKK